MLLQGSTTHCGYLFHTFNSRGNRNASHAKKLISQAFVRIQTESKVALSQNTRCRKAISPA